MVLAADYPFLEVLGTILVFFGFVVWFWLLISVFGDVFRRHDISGWTKLGWSLLVILLPLLGVLAYLIVNGREMGERSVAAAKAQKAEFDAYVRGAAGSSSGANEIARAKELLDSGAINEAEFEQIERRTLAS